MAGSGIGSGEEEGIRLIKTLKLDWHLSEQWQLRLQKFGGPSEDLKIFYLGR